MAHVRDGASNAYLAGEKPLNPDDSVNGKDSADNTSMFQGHDVDVNGGTSTTLPPMRDQPGLSLYRSFGRARAGSLVEGATQ